MLYLWIIAILLMIILIIITIYWTYIDYKKSNEIQTYHTWYTDE
jgi:hypothetical protein